MLISVARVSSTAPAAAQWTRSVLLLGPKVADFRHRLKSQNLEQKPGAPLRAGTGRLNIQARCAANE